MADKKHIVSMDKDCKFLKDLSENPNMALFNLACTQRDVQMWNKHKMKPNRFWNISDVKKYFGITGNSAKIEKDIMQLGEIVKDIQKQMKEATNGK